VALEKTSDYLSLGHYSPNTVRNYLGELRFLFVYYVDTDLPWRRAPALMPYVTKATRHA
jgi:hypothetical protein